MKTWLVACSKGGVGKTTIATQLAANAALSGLRTVLVDADPQGSATRWCERRAGMASAVLPLDGTRKAWRKRVPDDAQRLIVDAPAGSMADDLEEVLEIADAVVVPVQPSALDIEASVRFLESLGRHPRVRKGKLRVGLVGALELAEAATTLEAAGRSGDWASVLPLAVDVHTATARLRLDVAQRYPG